MELLIRDVVPDDAAGIVAIFKPIYDAGSFTLFDERFTVEAERSHIERLTGRDIFHIAVRTVDSMLVGFQRMSPFATYTHVFDHAGVIGTYVDVESRREGIAKRLFEVTLQAARRKGYNKMITYIPTDHPAALATYKKQGFHVVGTLERQAKVGGGYVDVVIVERFL
jgi:L-amino acid N-acyltransferase YncA